MAAVDAGTVPGDGLEQPIAAAPGSREELLDAEVDGAANLVPEAAILTESAGMFGATLAATPYRKVRCRMSCLDTFPASPVLVEVDSPTLPDMVVGKLQKAARAAAAAAAPGRQMGEVVALLQGLLGGNKLLMAMDEVRALKKLAKGVAEVKVKEGSGVIRVSTTQGAYSFTFSLTLTDTYPDKDGVVLKLHKTNFPKALVTPYMTQAREVVRRCVAGFAPEVALSKALPVTLPASLKPKAGDSLVLTTTFVRDLKEDVRFLKRAKDLRAVDSAVKSHNAKEHANTAKVRREARRKLKAMSSATMAAEEAREAAHAAAVAKEARAALTPHNDTPTKSAFWVAKYLLVDFARTLPVLRCGVSGKRLLSGDPQRASALMEDKKHAKHPVRVACGHWFLLRPLDARMRGPPFVHSCPTCSQRLYHPRWPADEKKLERAWGARLAKERELGDVADMLELGGEFATSEPDPSALLAEDGLHDDGESEGEEDLPPPGEGILQPYTPPGAAAGGGGEA